MKGIWFDTKHSYNDLHLVLSAVDIPPAKPKTLFVDIPGGDGSIDLTEAVGEVRFNDRECKFVFTAFPTDDFEQKKREVSNLINGKRMKIVLDKDPGYFYDGRCSVNEYASDRNLHQITVNATCSPYKLKTTITSKSVTASSTEKTVTLACGRRPVVPEITCTAAVTITQGSVSANLSAGTHKPLGIRLVEGSNSLKVKGSGSVTIKYQEGDL